MVYMQMVIAVKVPSPMCMLTWLDLCLIKLFFASSHGCWPYHLLARGHSTLWNHYQQVGVWLHPVLGRRLGMPLHITSEHGRQLTSAHWNHPAATLGTCPHKNTAYHPQVIGLVESFHRTLKSVLWAHLSGPDSVKPWEKHARVKTQTRWVHSTAFFWIK